jgi:hypothetical protein
MSFDQDTLYNLLPAVHRLRDAERGYPLRQLLGVIADQAAVLEENLEQLYDNQFVETAAPWALPYLADLLGLRGLSGRQALTRNPRAEVGHTVAYRRRKGTPAMLEQLAHDVTGWPARAVEFFSRLAVTQNVNHVRPGNLAFASLRDADELEFFNTPFETASRTVEVRRIASGRGKWNIPNVGLFLWRLQAYALTRSPLAPALLWNATSQAEETSRRHFRFHPLGLDAPLFSLPQTEDDVTHLAEPVNLPLPITKRMLRGAQLDPVAFPSHPLCFHPAAAYYGDGASLVLQNPPAAGVGTPVSIDASQVVICDLADRHDDPAHPDEVTGWTHEDSGTADGFVLLDPQRGRVVFPAPIADPANPPRASFHHGFSASVGGGEYERAASFIARQPGVAAQVPAAAGNAQSYATLAGALGAVLPALPGLDPPIGGIEITDSGRYELSLTTLDVGGGQLEVRAADGHRPLVRLTVPLEITGQSGGAVTLNGLLLAGAALKVTGGLGILRLRHCTLTSHLTVQSDGTLGSGAAAPCLVVDSPGTIIEIENCLLGPIATGADVQVRLNNCLVDARNPVRSALEDTYASDGPSVWTLQNCTVVGTVEVGTIALASNTIFAGGRVYVQRHQDGCMRFCRLPRRAHVPRRYRCVPDVGGPDVRPIFTSLRFGAPAYGQLSDLTPDAILSGADDESEMGVFHDLFQPQREAYLRARLPEYLRFGLEAGVFHAS